MTHRVTAAIDALQAQPRPHTAKKLVGSHDQWRIRVGDYRVLYDIT
jgi:mRNA interferase RelE/StbE